MFSDRRWRLYWLNTLMKVSVRYRYLVRLCGAWSTTWPTHLDAGQHCHCCQFLHGVSKTSQLWQAETQCMISVFSRLRLHSVSRNLLSKSFAIGDWITTVASPATPIFELDLHFGPNYTSANFHICISNGCNAIELTRFCWLSRTNNNWTENKRSK